MGYSCDFHAHQISILQSDWRRQDSSDATRNVAIVTRHIFPTRAAGARKILLARETRYAGLKLREQSYKTITSHIMAEGAADVDLLLSLMTRAIASVKDFSRLKKL